MEVEFSDPAYDRLETDRSYTHGFPALVVSAYRMCLQLLRAAANEADVTSMRMLGLASLGESSDAYSIRLADGYELTLELRARSPRILVWIQGVVRSKSGNERNCIHG